MTSKFKDVKKLVIGLIVTCLCFAVGIFSLNTNQKIKPAFAEASYSLDSDWLTATGLGKSTIEVLSFENLSEMPGGYSEQIEVSTGIYASYKTLDTGNYDVVVWSAGNILAPESCSTLFQSYTALTTLTFNNFDTSLTTGMGFMFSNCSNLIELDLSGFNTANVTAMYGMFMDCTNLESLDVSNFNTSKVNSVYANWHSYSGMFSDCYNLKSLDLSSCTFENVTDFTCMFINCKSLEYLNVSNFNTSKAKSLRMMFAGCSSLTNLDVSSFDTSNVTDMYGVFGNTGYGNRCGNLISLNISNFNTSNVTTMECLFKGCSGLTSLDVTHFDTKNVTSTSDMFSGCSSLTTIDISGFDTSNVTDMSGMFSGCSTLTTIDISGFDTSNVTDMSSMFSGCSGLTGLNVNIDTANVTTMLCMFYDCSGLTALDVSSFDTSKVTNMYGMFAGCTLLASLDVSNFDVTSVTTFGNYYGAIHGIFANCKSLTSLDLSKFNTISAKNMYGMFYNCSGLINLNISGLNTSNVTDMRCMFRGCSSLETLDLSNIDTSKVTNMERIFADCSGLTNLNLSGSFNTSTVENMSYMFANCSSLTGIDLRNLDTSSNKNFMGTFYGCTGLTSLDLSNFDTTNVVYFGHRYYSDSGMFQSCSSIKTLDLSNFDTSSATDISRMFDGCSGLTSLNLTGFNTSKVNGTRYIFAGCSSLTILDLSDFDFVSASATDSLGLDIFGGCTGLKKLITPYISDSTTTISFDLPANMYVVGNVDLGPINLMTNDTSIYGINTLDKTVLVKGYEITYKDQGDADFTGTFTETSPELHMHGETTTLVTPIRSGYEFKGWYLTEDCSGEPVTEITSVVEPLILYASWEEASYTLPSDWLSATALDKSTIEVLTFDYADAIPEGYSEQIEVATGIYASYKTLDSGKYDMVVWSPGNIFAPEKSSSLFYEYYYLTTINFNNFNTSNVIYMNSMFARCRAITSLNLSNFDTSKVTGMNGMFYSCSGLTSLNISGFDTSAVTDMGSMFSSCSSLTNIDVSHFDTSKATVMNSMFNSCSALTSLNISGFDTSVVTNMGAMFASCSSLTNIDVSHFDTSKCTNLNSLFSGCRSLTSIDVSNFDTRSATGINSMFQGCKGLTSLDLSTFNTTNVTNMGFIFKGCSGLAGLNISNFNTSNVTEMSCMFESCSSLTTLDLSNFDTKSVTSMYCMFSGCTNLKFLNISSFNTSKVTYMRQMFSSCSSLTTLDLSNFNTELVTSMYLMFSRCSGLTSLNVSSFNTQKVVDMDFMFTSCSSLTELDLSNFDTSSVTDMSGMFCSCSSLISLDLSSFNTSNVTNMYLMFYECTSLVSINLSSFNTSKVTGMEAMFMDCSSLKSLDLSSFDTSNVEIIHYKSVTPSSMFYNCISLESLNLTGCTFAKVSDFGYMFYRCMKLTSLDLSSFDLSNATNIVGMLGTCANLTRVISPHMGSNTSILSTSLHDSLYVVSNPEIGKVNKLTNDTSVYGISTLNKTVLATGHNITYKDQGHVAFSGAFAETSPSMHFYGETTTLVNPTKPGYEFKGWFTNANCTGEPVTALTNENCTSDITLYALWGRANVIITTDWLTTTGLDKSKIETLAFECSESIPTGYSEQIEVSTGVYTSYKTLSSGKYDIAIWSPGNIFAPQDCSNLFAEYTALKTISFNNFNTSSATNMSYMFYNCYNLKTLDVSNFNTQNVINMSYMFSECDNLTTLDLSNFNTKNVTDMSCMFGHDGGYGTMGLTSLNLSSFDTSNVTNMSCMFRCCSRLTSLDVSTFNTSNVTDMSGMFANSFNPTLETSYLTSLDLSNFNTSKVTDMGWMFTQQEKLTYLNISSFDTSNVTVMTCMFESCEALTSLDVRHFDTSNVTDMSSMFSHCESLTSLDVSSFNTSNVNDMWAMFRNCTSLTSLDLSNFDTSSVRDMEVMFINCVKLTNINLTSFDTSNLTTVTNMFANCKSLIELDLSSFNVAKVYSGGNNDTMLSNTNIKRIVTPYTTGTKSWSLSLPNKYYKLGDANNTPITSMTNDTATYGFSTLDKTELIIGYDITYKDQGSATFTGAFTETAPALHLYGQTTGLPTPTRGGYEFKGWFTNANCTGEPVTALTNENCTSNITLYALWGRAAVNLTKNWLSSTGLSSSKIEVLKFDYADAIPEGYSEQIQVSTDIYASYKTLDSGNYDMVVWSPGNITAPTSCSHMFSQCSALTTLTFINFDTSGVTDMSYMFYDLSNITVLDMSAFDTSNVTNMSHMFYRLSKITSLNVSMFDVANVTNMNSMFNYCQKAEVIDVSSFDTGSVTDMKDMFNYCLSVTSLDLSKFDVQNVTDMNRMFSYCVRLKTIKFSNFNTKSVRNMSKMFDNCQSLTGLDLSSFNTSNVIDMSYMFYYCYSIKSLDVSSFNTTNVTDMSYMFYKCEAMTSLNVRSFNTGNVTTMVCMFQLCEELYSLDVSSFDTRKVIDMSSMFGACRRLSSLDVSNFVTDNVTDMGGMFASCNALKALDLSNFNTRNVTDMHSMFSGGSALTSLNLSSFDTSKVTDMRDMFNYCENLTTLDVSHFDTANVTSMSYMFHNCRKLLAIDVSGFDTANVTNMSNMFNECYAVKELDVSGFNTKNVTSMAYMFSRCYEISSLDLSNFDTKNVTSMVYMFRSSGIAKLDLSNFDISSVTDVSNMFNGASDLTLLITPYVTDSSVSISIDLPKTFYTNGATGVISVNKATNDTSVYGISTLNKTVLTTEYYTIDYKDKGNSTFTGTVEGTLPDVYLPGQTIELIEPTKSACKFKGWYLTSDCSGEPITQLTSDMVTSNITLYALWERENVSITKDWLSVTAIDKATIEVLTFDYSEFIPTGYSEQIELSTGVYASYKTLDSGNYDMMVWSPGNIVAPKDCRKLFEGYINLKSIVFNNFDTSSVTIMGNMFSYCSGLISLDLSNFVTSSVTIMEYMFNGCSSLTSLDVSNFDTSSVTYMGSMFADCSSLTSLDISNFNTSSVISMSTMFSGCSSLTTLDLSNFNTSSAISMFAMFHGCRLLTSLDVSSFNTSSVTTMSTMFADCSSLTSLDLSNFNTSSVTEMSSMFNGCSSLTSLDISNFNTSSVTSMGYMFSDCSSLTSLDVSGFVTSSVTNMDSMFYNCSLLTSLDVSGFVTSSATSMRAMFYDCSSLTSLDVSGFNTSLVADMRYMFDGCSSLTSLDVSKFNTSSVANMHNMFSQCSGLTSLDVSGFVTSSVTDMSSIFKGCSSLTSLDVSNFNTSSVTDMSYMFYGCSSLTSLDVSSFNSGLVTDIRYMFYGCSSLTSLDLSIFDMSNTTHYTSMLSGCTNLKRLITPYISDSTKTKIIVLPVEMYVVGRTEIGKVNEATSDTSVYGISTLNKTELVVGYNITYKDKGGANFSGTLTNAPTLHLYGETTTLVNPTRSGYEFKGWYLTSDCSGTSVTTLNNENCTGDITLYAKWERGNVSLSSDWLSSTGLTNSKIEVLKFDYADAIPEGYSEQIQVSTDIYASYKTLDSGNYDMVVWSPGNIFAPKDCGNLFWGYINLKSIVFNNFDTSSVTIMGNMFSYCSGLISLDLSNFVTSSVTIMEYMFNGCSSLTSLDVSNFDTSSVTIMYFMFADCSSLTSLDVSNFDTSSVTIMYFMFADCSSLTSLDVSNFDTSSVTHMGSMFRDCSSLTSLDVSNFDTSKVTYMGSMFAGCSSLTSLDLSNDTSSVGDMRSMFYGCSSLTSIDLSKFDTSSVTIMYSMFEGCSLLTSIDLSKFDTSSVTDMRSMFYGCSSLTSLDVSGFVTSSVKSMESMFNGCSLLTSLDLSNFNTSSVTNMSSMFSDCIGLTSLDISNFNTSSVTEMIYMFYGCSSLTSIDLSNDTSSVTSMYSMFYGCSSLTSIDLSKFNTSSVTNMGAMFSGCSGLTSLDLSNFNTSSVTDMSYMFTGCSSLTSLDVSNFVTNSVTNMGSMFSGCSSLTSLNVSSFDTSKVTSKGYMFSGCTSLNRLITPYTSDSTKTITIDLPVEMYVVGHTEIGKVNKATSDTSVYGISTLNKTELVVGYNITYKDKGGANFSGTLTNVPTLHLYGETTTLVNPTRVGYNFKGWYLTSDCSGTRVTTLNNENCTADITLYALWEKGNYTLILNWQDYCNIDKDLIEIISLEYCDDIPSGYSEKREIVTGIYASYKILDNGYYDVVIWSPGNIFAPTDSRSLFMWFTNLKTITFNNFNTSKMQIMGAFPEGNGHGMFADCINLTSLDLSTFNTDNVTLMEGVFLRCSSLTSLNISGFNTTKVTSMYSLFGGCEALTSIDVSSFNTSNVTSMYQLFAKCISLTDLDLSNFNTVNVTNMDSMFFGCSSLDSLNLSRFTTANVTDMSSMFEECSELTSLDLTSFNASSLLNMHNMFFNCTALENIYFSDKFNTSKVTHMDQLFVNCSSLTSLDLTGFDSSSLVNMFAMFYGCTALENIYFSDKFNAKNVTDMSAVFYGCSSLTSLDLSGFNTESTTTMLKMFDGCGNLTALDISGFNTTKVTNMNSMFYDCKSLTSLDLTGFDVSNVDNMCAMFYGCVMLETIELSVFNAKNVTDMSGMFYNCGSLTSLDLSSFNTESATNMMAMFSKCSSLTSLDLNSFNTSNVTTMQNMFLNCSALTSLDASSFNTENVTTMYQMFANCSSLTSLNVTSFNTKNVTDMTAMFYSCSSLTSLDVSSFDTANVKTMSYMFDTCTNLTSLDLSNFNTSKVTTMIQMFARCPHLKSINVSSFDTSSVTTMQAMFYNNDALTSLDLSSFDLKSVTDISYMFAYTYNIKTFKTPYCSNSSKTISFALPPLYAGSWYYKNNVALGAVSTHACGTTSSELAVGYTISYKDKGGLAFTGSFSGEYPTLRLYGENTTLANPTKTGFRFVGWYLTSDCTGEAITTLTDANCKSDITLYANWIGRYNITWANYDGSVIYTETLDAGVMPTYSGETPVKPATMEFTYTFSGWTPKIVAVTKDATYKATFTETTNKYLITWRNYDGTILYEAEEEYGQMPAYVGETPVRERDVQYSYTFSGWTPEIVIVTGADSYTATYSQSLNKYMVTWLNYDGTKLYEEEVGYNTIPTYNGETPQKPKDVQYTYTFNGWTPEVTKVTGEATYTATFNETLNKYTITWLNYDGTKLLGTEVEYGKKPAYDGVTPTKPADVQYTYTFFGWTPEIVDVTGDASYTATFTETLNKYNITWLNYDNSELYSAKVEYGRIPTYTGETPVKPSDVQFTYIFSGWEPELTEVTGDATYKAVYSTTTNKYMVTWLNFDGAKLYEEEVEYGVVPSYKGETPQKPKDLKFTYTFSGWEPEVKEVSGEATYTATFTSTKNKYTITWLNYDNSELYSEQVEYGETPTYTGKTPEKPRDVQYTYVFKGWTPDITEVTKDASYTAIYTEILNKYLITWRNYDGTILYEAEEEYGQMPAYVGETPVRERDVQYSYTFSGWTPEIVIVTGADSYTATYSQSLNKYMVTWLNYDGTKLYEEEVGYNTIPTYNGETPQKPKDVQYTYTFNGWTPEVTKVTGEATYTATFNETLNKYTITWLNYDGTKLLETEVEYGEIPVYSGETPEKEGTDQYTYVFTGWDPKLVAVTGDATYTATYADSTNVYTITWLNYDGSQITTTQVEYGKMPVYMGETPQKPSDVQFSYTFIGWTPELVAVTGEATYTATFSETLNKYTITWLNYDGTEIYSAKVEYGKTPTYTGKTPEKPSDVQFSYTFIGWTPEVAAVTGNATYTATYSSTLNKYEITWLNYNGTLLLTTEVEYGKVPTYTGETPERPRDVKYTYTFSGWEPSLEAVTGEATYTATYNETLNKYTITWLNYDGTLLLTTEVEYGKVPTYTGETPEKEGDAQYTYVFTGWEPKLVAVTGDATYTATFADSANVYTITWLNYDGTELLTTEVEYGNMPTYTGETPVREKDAQYTYTFSGWTPELEAVTGNASYTATYTETINKYTITWLNFDGTELYSAQVEYGQMPTYTSETPVKEGNAQYSYTFSGWNPKVVEVTGDATYTAVFIEEINKYEITWVNYDGSVIYTEQVEYGVTPAYSGETPVKPGNVQYSYVFFGWEPIVAVVTCNAIYTAIFTEEVNKYTITWKNYDSEVLLVEEVAYGTVPVYTGETPEKEGSDQYSYIFTGWDPVPVAVTGDASYTATFANSTNVYTITWLNYDGSELLKTNVEYGELPVYTGELPVKEGNEQYSYEFSGWMPELVLVTSDATYTATFNEILNKYLVKWLNYDGTELLKQELNYGTMPEYTGETPVRERDKEFTYTFSGWMPEIVVVTGNATYTAKYTAVVNKYIVIWLNYDGTELYREELEYGATPEYKGETPAKEGNAQYSYKFSGWVPEMTEITGDITYTAQFTEIVNKYTITWENYDGSLIYYEQIEYGRKPTYTGETPVKPATAEFTYTFIGWTPEIVEVTSDATYTATFDYIVNKYTIIWLNWDESELYRSDMDYGTTPEYFGETPVKENNEQFTYTFIGWTPEVTRVTGNATYKANFKEEVNKYVITWVNYNGAVLQSEEVAYGQMPTYAGITPVKEGNAQYSYIFSSWTPEIVEVTEDATYTAVFTEEVNKYTIIWVNYDNTELLKQELEYGEMPEYTGETPVRFADEDNKYIFSKWTPEVDIVTKDITYTAVFTTIEIFEITWKNYDGTILRVDKVECGTMPVYGEVSPTRPKDAQYTYTFVGWTPEVVLATRDVVYVATFEATLNTYNISLKYVKGDEVLGMVNYTVNFADVFTLNIARDNLSILSVMVNDEEIEVEDNRIVIPSVTEDLEIVVYYTEKITGFIVPIAIIAGSAMLIFALIFIIKKIKEKADDNADTSEAYRKLVQANGLNVGNIPTPEQPTSVNAPKPEIIDTINRQVGVSGQVKQGSINKPIAKPSVNAPQKPIGGETIKKPPAKPAGNITKPTMSKPANVNAGTKLPPKPVAPKAPPKPPAKPQ